MHEVENSLVTSSQGSPVTTLTTSESLTRTGRALRAAAAVAGLATVASISYQVTKLVIQRKSSSSSSRNSGEGENIKLIHRNDVETGFDSARMNVETEERLVCGYKECREKEAAAASPASGGSGLAAQNCGQNSFLDVSNNNNNNSDHRRNNNMHQAVAEPSLVALSAVPRRCPLRSLVETPEKPVEGEEDSESRALLRHHPCYDLASYQQFGLPAGAHGWLRPVGLLQPSTTKKDAPDTLAETLGGPAQNGSATHAASETCTRQVEGSTQTLTMTAVASTPVWEEPILSPPDEHLDAREEKEQVRESDDVRQEVEAVAGRSKNTTTSVSMSVRSEEDGGLHGRDVLGATSAAALTAASLQRQISSLVGIAAKARPSATAGSVCAAAVSTNNSSAAALCPSAATVQRRVALAASRGAPISDADAAAMAVGMALLEERQRQQQHKFEQVGEGKVEEGVNCAALSHVDSRLSLASAPAVAGDVSVGTVYPSSVATATLVASAAGEAPVSAAPSTVNIAQQLEALTRRRDEQLRHTKLLSRRGPYHDLSSTNSLLNRSASWGSVCRSAASAEPLHPHGAETNPGHHAPHHHPHPHPHDRKEREKAARHGGGGEGLVLPHRVDVQSDVTAEIHLQKRRLRLEQGPLWDEQIIPLRPRRDVTFRDGEEQDEAGNFIETDDEHRRAPEHSCASPLSSPFSAPRHARRNSFGSRENVPGVRTPTTSRATAYAKAILSLDASPLPSTTDRRATKGGPELPHPPASVPVPAATAVAAGAPSAAPMATKQQQHDRRVDDLFVKHRDDGSAMYSISLTYHDSVTGASRTVDAQALPPLRPSKKTGDQANNHASSAATPSRAEESPSPATTSVMPLPPPASSTTMGPTTLPSMSLRRPSEGGLTTEGAATTSTTTSHTAHSSTTAAGAATPFGAPLPATEPLQGPRLQGVAGRSGEMAIGAFLGGGACGKVYECLNTQTGQVLAAKQIVFDAKDRKLRSRLRQLELELEALTLAAKHNVKWIVGFYGAEKRGHSVLMYLEYCQRGSLLDYMTECNSHDAAVWGSCGLQPVVPHPTLASMLSSASLADCASEDDEEEEGAQSVKGKDEGVDAAVASAPHAPAKPSPSPFHRRVASSASTCSSSVLSSAATMSLEEAMHPQMPPLSIHQVQTFTRQILTGLSFLHAHHYAHLDVKTANVLITQQEECRLADLGCAMRLQAPPSSAPSAIAGGAATGGDGSAHAVPYPALVDHEAITELRGTALYMAPEMVRFERSAIGGPSDIWSLGCVVMEMATGCAPWRHIARDKLRVLYRVGSAREELPLPPLVRAWGDEARNRLRRAEEEDEGDDKHPRWEGYEAMPLQRRRTEAEQKHSKGTATKKSALMTGSLLPLSSPLTTTVSTFEETEKKKKMNEEDEKELHTHNEGEEEEEKSTPLRPFLGPSSFSSPCEEICDEATTTAAEERRTLQLYALLDSFIAACVKIHPEERSNAEELLQHPFLCA